MSANEASKRAQAASYMRKGATLLKDPCPKCGGVQLLYQNRRVCVNCGDLTELDKGPPLELNEVVGLTKDASMVQLRKLTERLGRAGVNNKEVLDEVIRCLEVIERANRILKEDTQK
jgi:UPF0148 protein